MPPKYVKKDPISHILDRPDTWVGSIRSRSVEDYVVVDDKFHIAKKKIDISPAIIRMFIEPLSNVIDNVARSNQGKNKTKKIAVSIDQESGEVSFWNDGEVIPVEMHEEEKVHNHTMIFGQLLTGSNYDDTEDREDISGRNGIGIKAVNVYSKEFKVEGLDPENGKKFEQTWTNNMRTAGKPKVTSTKLKKGYTKISYTLDFGRFGLEGYTDDLISLYKRYVVDCAMITKVPVFFNDEEIPVSNLSDYAKLYSLHEVEELLYIKTAICEVVLTPSSESEVISFANGIFTPLGGTHVDAWTETLFRPIVDKLNKPKKPQINLGDVKKFFRLFVVATVKQPSFDSQSKFRLEAPEITAILKPAQLKTILSWSVIEKIEDIIRAKEMVVLKKSERKRGYEKVEKLQAANNEGGAKGHQCTLILVEGDSAATYAVTGIQKGVFGKTGRDWNGIMPLRGKVLNCRGAKPLTVSKNRIITNIIKALGLKYNVDYSVDENWKKLRYGRVMIITDADVDGLHISALLQNMFHSLFPTLLDRDPPFLTAMQTPIVRVYQGKKEILFYDENEYREYVKKMGEKKINKKYYKGLGTSTTEEVLETFGEKIIEFRKDDKVFETMNKAFNEKHADMRKTWLAEYDPSKTVIKWKGEDQEIIDVSYSDFINTELIKFSIDDCKRSIPSLMDGLKESQRKVLYVSFLRNLKYFGKDIKVAQLAGAIAEKSGYHHGENNLHETITGMADAYVGSNNIPLFFRGGAYGTRSEGGKDAAQARYLFTKFDALTRHIFKEEDDPLLQHLEDDGEKVEPRYYVPIIPMALVNGTLGIGTGWSSTVPCFNPSEIISAIKVWLEHDGNVIDREGEHPVSLLPHLRPWYRGHTGEMEYDEKKNRYLSLGKLERIGENKVHITELPVGLWTNKFVEHLETLKEEKKISSFKNHSTPTVIDFTVMENSSTECDEKLLKLSKPISMSNLVLFTEEGKLKKFESVDEIIDSFCHARFPYYFKRKAYLLKDMERKIKYLGNKKRFLEEVRDGEIKLFEMVGKKRQSRKTKDIVAELEEKGYDKEEEGEETEEDEGEEKKERKSGHGYEYLLKMQISSITAEKINKLKNDIASNIEARDELQRTSEKQLWIKDLDDFEKAYESWLVVMSKEKVIKKKPKK